MWFIAPLELSWLAINLPRCQVNHQTINQRVVNTWWEPITGESENNVLEILIRTFESRSVKLTFDRVHQEWSFGFFSELSTLLKVSKRTDWIALFVDRELQTSWGVIGRWSLRKQSVEGHFVIPALLFDALRLITNSTCALNWVITRYERVNLFRAIPPGNF